MTVISERRQEAIPENLTDCSPSRRREIAERRNCNQRTARLRPIHRLMIDDADMGTEEDKDGSRPTLDADLVSKVIGKHLLVGLTYVRSGGELIEQKEKHGTVERINDDEGIVLRLPDGTLFKLPPDLRGIKEAEPGVYRLRS